MVIEEILPPETFDREWRSTDYCKTSDFFFSVILLLVNSAAIIDYFEIPTFLIDEHKSR